MSASSNEIFGVVEGFYGKPWSQAERFTLFDWLRDWHLNAYLYAPKDDLKHRVLWREFYTSGECDQLQALIRQCDLRGVKFIYALAPGLDMHYSKPSERELIQKRFDQMLALGCRHFALLFDDIPARMSADDANAFPSFSAAHVDVTNRVFHWLRAHSPNLTFLFCPTPYCGRMLQRELGGAGYLETIGRDLAPEIQVLWTGPEIISRTISVNDLPLDQLRRKPVLWDNLHANDYDRSRFYVGPYSGRDSNLLANISGILSNPNNEFRLNYVALRTLAMFRRDDYVPRDAYQAALHEWHGAFETVGAPITREQLGAFADCYYLPHEDGPEANALYNSARARPAEYRERSARVRDFCQRATELRDRELFYALSQRIWDLREELDLLDRAVESADKFTSDFHLPGTYRGGFVRRLQRVLSSDRRGTFSFTPMNDFSIRNAQAADQSGTYFVCLKTGDFGKDGELFYRDDPDALGRIFVGPYLAFEPQFALVLEDSQGICGYAFGALDSRQFYQRYEQEWRPGLCAEFAFPKGDPAFWTRTQHVHSWYHQPDYFCPEPYDAYPSHLHIDLLERAQGRGFGRRMLAKVMDRLRERGSPGAHLGVSARNAPAFAFYEHLGFWELVRVGTGDAEVIYMGRKF